MLSTAVLKSADGNALQRLRGEKHLETAQAASDLAVLLAVIGGKAEESESLFQQSIDILEGISGLQPIRLAKTFLVTQQNLALQQPLLVDEPCSLFSHPSLSYIHNACTVFAHTMEDSSIVMVHSACPNHDNNARTPTPVNAGLCRPPEERIAPPRLRDSLSALL